MKRRIIILIVIMALTACFSGCDRDGQAPEGVTTGFDEDTVFTVADQKIGLAEWYMYALPERAEAESMYGPGIGSFVVDRDGMTLSEAMKEDVRQRIEYIKIVSQKAPELGIELSEDDMIDINLRVQDYMGSLTSEQKSTYGITEELVRRIYEDNLLAMKVYENLTLNIDTNIPEEEVRHMVLQYIVIRKYEQADDGERRDYTAEELAAVEAEAESFLEGILADAGVEVLEDVYDERYSVIELVADYSTLIEKLPGELPGIAFNMRENEINGLYETEDAFFIFDCVKRIDEAATNAARIDIIEERQKELFEEKYESWKAETITKLNYKVWDELKL